MQPPFNNLLIPGTILEKKAMGDVNGMVFLNKIFFITDGIMLAQIREISGIDSSTLQNWVKRGWICKPEKKRYSKDQLARILIINMLRKNTQLEKIDFLLRYINGNPNSREDDIIQESVLYDYITRIIDTITEKSDGNTFTLFVRGEIERCTADYTEPVAGAARRMRKALEIIVVSYYSALLALHAENLFNNL